MRPNLSPRWIAPLFLSLVGCSGSPSGPSSLVGIWGGDHLSLTVGESSSHLEFDCAHGDIPDALKTDARILTAAGTFVREHGGPIRVGELPDVHPALYSGTLMANTLQLTVRLTDDNELIGAFTLVRGVTGRVFKCL